MLECLIEKEWHGDCPKASRPRCDDEQVLALWNMNVDNCLSSGILAKLNGLNESSGNRYLAYSSSVPFIVIPLLLPASDIVPRAGTRVRWFCKREQLPL